MSSLSRRIAAWVDSRIAAILATPRMWGSNEAVELQVLLLHEIRALALRPAEELASPRAVLEAYQAFLLRRFPGAPPSPLFELVDASDATTFRDALEEFTRTQQANSGDIATPEPFDTKDVIRAIDLDRGFLVLGKQARIPCYVRPERLHEIAQVGVSARVVGERYRPLRGPAFVLADRVEVEGSSDVTK